MDYTSDGKWPSYLAKQKIAARPSGRNRVRSLSILLLIAVLVVGVLYAKELSLTRQLMTQNPLEKLNTLIVLNMLPNDYAYLPKKLVFYFNSPVDPHQFAHFFEIRPKVPGSFANGAGDTIIEFTPEEPFVKGVTYHVRIEKGLVGKNNLALTNDYSNSFSTGISDTDIQFVNDHIQGRVLSYPAHMPVTLTVMKPESIASLSTDLYRSDEDQLLKFLTYVSDTIEYDSYNSTVENYLQATLDHPESSLINSIVVTKNEQQLSFTLQPGIYYLEAKDPTNSFAQAVFLTVNRTGLVVRQDDKNITLGAFDLETNTKNRGDIEVGLYTLRDVPTYLGRHTFSGSGSFPLAFNHKLDAIIAHYIDEVIFVPMNLPQSLADINVTSNLDEESQLFIYTDRPIYKPGDTVSFRGLVRTDSDAQYKLPYAGKQVRVWTPNRGNISIDQILSVDSHGVFRGTYTLPKDTTDTIYLYASTNLDKKIYGSSTATTYFDVQAYVKPEFEITASVPKEEYIRNDTIMASLKGAYFNGNPLKNRDIAYEVYTQSYFQTEKAVYNTNFNIVSLGMCGAGFGDEYLGEPYSTGSLKLSENGTGQITLPPPKNASSQKVTLVAHTKDTYGNELTSAVSTIVHASGNNIFFMPSSDTYQKGQEVVAPFYAETQLGVKLTNQEFIYKLLTDYSSSTRSEGAIILSGKVSTDGNGRGLIRFSFPYQTDNGYLVIEKTDEKGNLSQNYKYLRVASSKSSDDFWDRYSSRFTYLQVRSDKNSFTVGDTIRLVVVSPQKLNTLVTYERGRVYSPQIVSLNTGENILEVPVSQDFSPSITIVFSFFADGIYRSEGVSLNVPAMHRLLDVTVTPDKTRYNPNETAQIKVTTNDPTGGPVSAQLSLAVVDKAIFALRQNATSPVHSSFYYYRPRRTNASSSLTAVGTYDYGGGRGGGGGGGEVLGGKLVDTLYWNPNLSTSTNGEVIVPIPLQGIVTTWKAQAYASTDNTMLGQDDAEFLVAP
ncbi:hypothetical protein HY408_01135 [Candidatus Gottesmanbacteria bacterium]|nr:hypothetical protein [Candidatus Gottesmanbacteria bacterium]